MHVAMPVPVELHSCRHQAISLFENWPVVGERNEDLSTTENHPMVTWPYAAVVLHIQHGRQLRLATVPMRVDETRHGWSTWEWLFGLLVILSFTSCLPLARRLPMIVRTVAQWVLFLAPVLLIAISWDRFGVARSDQSEHRSRIWVSFVGCNALAAALVVPAVTVFFGVFLAVWA